MWYDFVRPGLLLYGVVPPPLASTIPLKPVMSLTSRVVAVKGLRPGEAVGYGSRFTSSAPATIAVVPAGYADGLDDLGIAPSAGGQPFISPDFSATGTISKSGYNFTYAALGTAITGITTCSTVTAATPLYESFAAPTAANGTGVRYFGTNETQTLYEDADASPSPVTFNLTTRNVVNGTVVQ